MGEVYFYDWVRINVELKLADAANALFILKAG